MNEPDFDKVKAIVESAIEQGAFPGAVLTAVYRGDLVHHEAYGHLSWTLKEPTTVDTVYDLASVTKVFTATALLKLIEQGMIGLETSAEEVAPELRGSCHGPLTVRQLLEHTSGQPRRFTRIIEAEAAFALAAGPTVKVSEEERARRIVKLLEDLRDVELLFSPGSRVAYTSLGYFLLGVMVERLTGKRLDEYLDDTLTKPLGLASLSYLPLASDYGDAAIAPTEVCPWRRIQVRGQVHDEITAYLGGISGHAGLFGRSRDLVAFGVAVLENKKLGVNPKLLARSVQSQTRGLPGEERGWGWLIRSVDSFMGDFVSPYSFGHTGFTGTSLLVDPESELVVSLLTNRVNGTRRNNRIGAVRKGLHDRIAVAVGALDAR
jgi:CubicO group peptidase (beta-lactamase class C family)